MLDFQQTATLQSARTHKLGLLSAQFPSRLSVDLWLHCKGLRAE
jgi:hypothetical protein